MRSLAVPLTCLLCACSGAEATVLVDLRTDLLPGVEFTGTAVSLDDGAGTFMQPAFDGEDFVGGQRIAEIEGLSRGDYALRIRALDASGAVVAERPLRVTVESDVAITVLITRDCAGLTCPAPMSDATLSACVGSRCVDPRCLAGTEASCPEPACTGDADCPDDGSCGRGACREGVCLTVADDSACASEDRCVPGVGCTPRELAQDAGIDAGPGDSGVDAGPPDSGPADSGLPDGPIVYLDSADVDGAGTPGGSGCPGAAGDEWRDMITTTSGTLAGFPAIPCDTTASGGWSGAGTPADPHRLVYSSAARQSVSLGRIGAASRYTVEAWIRWTGSGDPGPTGTGGISLYPIVAKGAAEAERVAVDVNYTLGISAMVGTLATDYEDAATSTNHPLTGTTPLTPGAWHHVAVTFDHAELRLYLDGTLDRAATQTAPPSVAVDSHLGVGADLESDGALNGGHFDGDIAIVRIFDRALSAAEIRAECDMFAPRFEGLGCGP